MANIYKMTNAGGFKSLTRYHDMLAGNPTYVPLPTATIYARYDASVSSSITSSGGKVSAWADISGNGFNVSQATSAWQPSTGSDVRNGLNVLTFNGNSLFNSTLDLGTGFTMFIVARHTSINGQGANGLAWFGTDSTTAGYIAGIARSTTISSEGGSGYAQTLVSSSINTWYRIAHRSNNSTNFTSINNATSTSASEPSGMNPNPGLTFGSYWGGANPASSFPFLGNLAEVIIYNSVLSDSDMTLVDVFLRDKWGF
jgi:hypothetical protein